jgi:fatty-acyl-CoA synthase
VSAEPATLVELLDRAAEHPEVGLRLLDRSEAAEWRSWSEIRVRALAVCGGLQASGVAPGDRVALVFPTGWEFFDAFFGVALAGAVPAPLYPPVRLGRLGEYQLRTGRMVAAAGAVLVLAERRVRRLLGEAVADARPRLGCLVLDQLPLGRAWPASPQAEELALVQFSSGTTMEPRAVALSHCAVVTQARLLNRFWPDAGERRHSGVSWLPLYHDMGLIGCVLPALERPGPLTLLRPEDFVSRPALWLRAISRYRASVSPGPNFAFGLCVERVRDEELDGVDLSCWEVALCGAEAVAPSVVRAFQERFARWGLRPEAVTPVYGLSEAALAVTFSDLGRPFGSRRFDRERLARGEALEGPEGVEIVSVGRPLPGFALAVRDADGVELPEGRVGDLLVAGPSLMAGYLGQPEATAGVLRDGWLATGDLGFLLEGELYLTGRAKDVLILRGANHAPEEVERATSGVAGVRAGCAAAVSWLPEGAAGEVLVLLVETRRGVGEGEHAAIAAACRERVLASTGLDPERVVLLPAGALPRTSSGKIRRAEALRQLLAGELKAPREVTTGLVLGAMARSAVAFARGGIHRKR